jgi:phosphopantothenoylcysteine synthetase/decarboxylase
MNCLVTAGPTYERMDKVRRLTNFSTGSLGCDLAAFLACQGHDVNLLLGEQATARPQQHTRQAVETFNTTSDLLEHLKAYADRQVQAVFHAAAVNDFTFGRIFARDAKGEVSEVNSGKISTRQGNLLAELVPTPKVIAELRKCFPRSRLVGWKYEVEGDRSSVVRLAEKQLTETLTDACVANGPAYGQGYGLAKPGGECVHIDNRAGLLIALEKFILE